MKTRIVNVVKHGHSRKSGRSKTYKAWLSVIGRCTLPNDKDYGRWGGRGITVCDRWKNSFVAFLEDMGEAPIGLSIDRIDNSKGYEPGNCRWATAKEQANNRRNNHRVEYGGEVLTISQWAERTGIHKAALRYRLAAGWSITEALTVKVDHNNGKRKGAKNALQRTVDE